MYQYIKTPTSASLSMLNLLTAWIKTNCGKFLKRWEYQTTLPVSWETCMQVKKQQLEQDMEQRTGSKVGKEYIKVVYCHPAYLTHHAQCWSALIRSWNQDCQEKHNSLRYADNTNIMAESKLPTSAGSWKKQESSR